MLMPSTSADHRKIERQRQIPNAQLVDANELANIVIEDEFANEYNGMRFLLHDSRDTEPLQPVFFIFCTQLGLERLNQFNHWSGDGTFKVVPNHFLQLYTLNVLVDESSVPSAFILMANKASETYRRASRVIRAHLNALPETVMLDFEQSAKNAFKQIWPFIEIRLCLFHLGQSILRKTQKIGLMRNYENDMEMRINVRSLAALSLLPIHHVNDGFNALRQVANPISQPIFDYFGRTYVIGMNNGEPLFPIIEWNHHAAVLANLARTNNAQEGYHLALRRAFQNLHPHLSRFIIVLKGEERIMQDRVRIYQLDNTRGLNLRPRSTRYKTNDRAIKQLIENFDRIQAPNNEQILSHLRAIQFRLAANNFDFWE